jgi:hypothetical protein
MRKVLALLIVCAPLLAACSIEEPILPELKGRWSAPNMIKAMEERRRVEQVSMKTAAPTTQAEMCRAVYVTFGKRAVRANVFGNRIPLFSIDSAKREGSRIILTGRANKANAESAAKIELVLRNGEVRFDDIYDATGRSIKYEPLPEEARGFGVTALGDLLALMLNVKPCPAA